MQRLCTICKKAGCKHTEEDIKKYEIERAWEAHKELDPDAARSLSEEERYDQQRNAYKRIYRENKK